MSAVYVFDTYATRPNGRIMHFDVVLPENDAAKALAAARHWLASIGAADTEVRAERCCYCHSEPTAPEAMRKDIESQGYAIYKLEGCPA
jgi:hypothetical protein